MSDLQQASSILKQYWGFDHFRPFQGEVIASVLEDRDTLALLPTGGGKSVCYQVPALCRDGLCLVISPLIALMKDQVAQLKSRGIKAAAVFSGMHFREIERILDNCVFGDTRLLYVSPERLSSPMILERIGRMQVNLIAVDEAHCISQWGYDFRQSYLKIVDIRKHLPRVPVLALTATATTEVVRDIQEKLQFVQPAVFQSSFERPNLSYVVLNEDDKQGKLLEIIRKVPGSGVVYTRNRKKTKEIAQYLIRHGIAAGHYHAGLGHDERNAAQDAWMRNETRIMVSTNAFGMGIDKPDVRLVVHLDLPNSLEAYFQEAGRAGRDGKRSYAVLLYNPGDRHFLEHSYESAFPTLEEVRRTYQALGSYFQLAIGSGMGQSFDFDIQVFSKNYGFDLVKTFNCLKTLEQEGWVALSDDVFVPSTLQILADKHTLYDYQLKNKSLDPVIKAILRACQGAFQHPVAIQETQLAAFLKISKKDLASALRLMQHEGILEYQPQKDVPQLTLLQERTDAANLDFDVKRYNFRKNRYLERMKAAITYAETPVCRSLQLLAYFGETGQPCGHCDVCLGRTRSDMTDDDFQRYREKIRVLLDKDVLALDTIVEAFSPKRRQQVLKALEYLTDEGWILSESGKLRWNKNKTTG